MKNKGQLLVSTKTSGRIKILQLVATILELCFGLFFLFNFKMFGDMGKDLLDSRTLGIVIGIVLIAIFFSYPIFVIIGNQSYCDVYENAVAGMTGLSLKNLNSAMQKFEIRYDEIINVTESQKTIYIHTSYKTYEVLAMSRRSEALMEIRKRIS